MLQLLRQRVVSQLEEDGHSADLVQAVAGDGVSDHQLLCDPMDVRERLLLLVLLRDQQRLAAVQAVVAACISACMIKGDLDRACLNPASVIDATRFESPSEAAMLAVIERLEPLAAGRDYKALADALVEATPALEAFFDGDDSVMVMAEDPALRVNRLNLLAVLRNQASQLARFDLIQS